jgi:colicin import membrane protein
MKTGITTSVILHAAVLTFGLFTLSAPRPYEVGDVEALPVDIVPVQSITQVQEGDKKAPKKEKSAPKPTIRPEPVKDAQKVGENNQDMKNPPTPEVKPKPVEKTAEPPPAPEPVVKPAEKPVEQPPKQAEAKPEPVPATERTPQAQPKQEVKPDPVQQAIVAENPDAEAMKLPETAPSPEARPQPPQAQTAKAPDRKVSDKPAVKEASRQKSEDKDFSLDKVAALLNKEKASGGGAKRSTDEASLGADHTTGGDKLSQSEMDALRSQLAGCWTIPAGVEDADQLKVTVEFSLSPDGHLEGAPRVVQSAGSRQADESALRAVNICNQRGFNLPSDKYQTWANVVVHFDPSDMF